MAILVGMSLKIVIFFFKRDKHKYTGINKTFKLNFNQNINKINFGTSVMSGLRIQLYMKCLAQIILDIQEIET